MHVVARGLEAMLDVPAGHGAHPRLLVGVAGVPTYSPAEHTARAAHVGGSPETWY